MAVRVIHIGEDHCHRLPVLECAGYKVDGCISVVELRLALKRTESLEAVLVGESEGVAHQDMIREVREHTGLPMVLFRETLRNCTELAEERLFDLEVPVLQPPDTWLTDLAELIARCQAIRAQSQEICSQARQLCQQSAALRERSRLERLRSLEVRKKIPHPEGLVRGPKNSEES